MSSRPRAHHCVDYDDDDYLSQPPKRIEEATASREGVFIPKAPKKDKRLKEAYLDASSAVKPRAVGVAARASTSVARSTETVSTSNVRNSQYVEETPPCNEAKVDAVTVQGLFGSTNNASSLDDNPPHETRVGAMVVRGLSESTSNESSMGDTPPQSTAEEQPLQATLVAEPAILAEDAVDIEAQVQARMHSEAEDIANMVHRRIFQDTAMAVVHTDEEPASSATKCEGDNGRKKKCILLVAVLVIAAAIGVGVGVPLSKESSDTTSSTEAFRNVLFNISGNSLDNETSSQFQALNWIANEDPADTSVGITDNEIIKQRYVAAVLYYALGGENWFKTYNFLTGLPVCSWNQDQTGIICNSTNDRVETLRLSKNGIIGSIPEEIGYFSNLSIIAMTEGAITGTLPSSLAELNLLELLNFSNCELVGTIPDFLYTHEQLTEVDLNNNSFTGTIHPSLGNSTRLETFWVRGNELTGPIPASIGQSSVLTSVDMGWNSLTGVIPEFLPSSELRYLLLNNNDLVGTIPSSIGDSHFLQYIFLTTNALSGTIPTELGLLRSLELLYLWTNGFTGSIPSEIGQMLHLNKLIIRNNALNGTIPSELGLLSNLAYLDLNSNKITGTVPTILANLSTLEYLFLFDNDLTGTLDAFCGINYEYFAANTCGQDEIECECCTHCCDPNPDIYDCEEI